MVLRKAYDLGGLRRGAASLLAALVAVLLWGHSAAAAQYNFKLEELSTGEQLDLDLLTDGKPLIVHVWSPECPHCQRHMPYLVGLYKKVDLEQVNFVTLSMSDSRQDALDYIRQKRLSFPVLFGGGGDISDNFSANGWPTTFVFAPGGKLVGTCDTQSSAYIGEVLDLVERALNN